MHTITTFALNKYRPQMGILPSETSVVGPAGKAFMLWPHRDVCLLPSRPFVVNRIISLTILTAL